MIDTRTGSSAASPTAAEVSLDRVRTTLAVAQGLAVSGREIDLTGLDAAAGVLCAQVLDLPPEEGATLCHALRDLRAKLAVLTETIRHAP